MNPRPISHYAHAIKRELPPEAFRSVPSRLGWLALHLATAAVGTFVITRGWGGLWAAVPLALVIGHAFAGMAFVGHETLHGAVVRQPLIRHVIGWICFLPFTMSPRIWVAWHNKVHHGHTMEVGVDPDAYPTVDQYDASKTTRIADYLSVGRGRLAGIFTLLLGFTGQSTQILLRQGWRPGYLSRGEYVQAVVETVMGISFWALLGWLIGPLPFLFAFVIPLLVANSVVIAYILTNHSLSPITGEVNDPLLNSLTVTAPRIVELMHLNFGLHVEHHMFPAVSSKYAPLIRDAIVARWPERYQSLPVMRALQLLWNTPRVYSAPTVLQDQHTGAEFSTLVPGAPHVSATVETGDVVVPLADLAS